jgi:hypothetical protein
MKLLISFMTAVSLGLTGRRLDGRCLRSPSCACVPGPVLEPFGPLDRTTV